MGREWREGEGESEGEVEGVGERGGGTVPT